MKISTKIYGGFGLMLVIMLVIVGAFYIQYQVIEKATQNLTHHQIPQGSMTQKLALEASREAAAIRGYLATGNPKFKQDLDQAISEAEVALKYLNDHTRNKELLKPVVDAKNTFTPHLSKMVDLYASQGQAVALTYMVTTAAPLNAAFLAEIEKYVKRQDKLIEENIKMTDEQQRKMLITIITILSIGLILGAASAAFIARPILAAIRQGVSYSEAMAQGTFNQRLEIKSTDEIGILLQSLSNASANLRSLVKQVSTSAEAVAASSEELTASAEQSAQAANQVAATITSVAEGAENQVQAVNTTAAVVEQMSSGIRQVAVNANAVTNMADKTTNAANQGNKAVDAAVNQMESIEKTVSSSAQVVMKLGERSKEIGQIVDTISGIAGQLTCWRSMPLLRLRVQASRAEALP